MRGRFNIAEGVTLDPSVRYISSITYGDIPSYWQAGLRLGWKYDKNWEFAISGQDLLNANHLESAGTVFAPPQITIERSLWAEVSYSF